MTKLPLTPSQTIGPFLHKALAWSDGPEVVPTGTPGSVWLRGHVYDGAGEPVADALVETWQADPTGGFDDPEEFRAFGRSATDGAGTWGVRTLKPGPITSPDGVTQAPHVDVSVFARGLLDRVVTRIYFADEDAANAADPVLSGVEQHRRGTLVARPVDDGYRFDIHLQGEAETVFFDV
ncbi:MAG: protocatechuate 3,4-dioxygenase subunit alpha [Actinomycetes bacterium]